MKKYGIMGGTFDPIHLGHLMIAEYIREEIELDEIIFVPTGNPPHKNKVTRAQDRYNMTKAAIEDNEFFTISDIETKNEGYSYSFETIGKFRKILDGKIYFIIGSDTLYQLKTWKKPEEIAQMTEFICALRPDFSDYDKLQSEVEKLNEKFGTVVHIVKTPRYEISSTDVRCGLKSGKSMKYVLSDKVKDYIEKNDLYK